MKKYILVTGSEGGLGRAVVNKLLKNNYIVFGLDNSISQIKNENYIFIKTDITNQNSIENAYEIIKQQCDYLYAIINIAGILYVGSFIESNADNLRKILDVNVVGMCRINQIFFPLLVKGKSRIINFSSEYGKYTTVPFNGFYTCSKHAVESYSDGLRRELQYLGIKVIVIRPGAFVTPMEEKTTEIFIGLKNTSDNYSDIISNMEPMLLNGTRNAKQPEILAKVVMRAINSSSPKRYYKCNHNIGMKILSIFNAGFIDKIFYFLFKSKTKRGNK